MVCNSISINVVPAAWAAVAYPSLKPLAAWFKDFERRFKFFQSWVSIGPPAVFWLSGLFFPQAFFTVVLQNYARKYKVAIDQVQLEYELMSQEASDIKQLPADGNYINGMFMQGSKWDCESKCVGEAQSKELYSEMPVIWLKPCLIENATVSPGMIYRCPMYKTLLRAGTLSTTGHSTNYVVTVPLASKKSESYWTKRGVAMFCALDY